jgi:hypothetical protein
MDQKTHPAIFRVKFSGAQSRPTSLRKAQAHAAAMIKAISKAHIKGKHKQADILARRYLDSMDARFAATATAYNHLKQHQRPDARLVWDYAQSMNPWAVSQETVQIRLIPKESSSKDVQTALDCGLENDDFRTVLDFGLENRGRQHLVLPLLKARADLHPNQYGTRGPHAAIKHAADLLAQGYQWAIETDIANCYPSFDGEKVADLLPIPKRVTRGVILGASLQLRLHYPNQFGSADPEVDDELIWPDLFADARRGLPQGSATSTLAAEISLAPLFNSLPAGGVMLGYADNFLAMAKDESDVMSTTLAFWSAAKAHPAGHFQPKKPLIYGPDSPIEWLGHELRLINGHVRIKPTRKNTEKFEKRLGDGLHKIKSLDATSSLKQRHVRELRRYVSAWCASFKLCEGMEQYRSKALDRVNKAVPISWKSS